MASAGLSGSAARANLAGMTALLKSSFGKSPAVLRRLFFEHPGSVGETYREHLLFAARFGLVMIRGGLGALVHAVVPGWCQTTGSDTVVRLNRLAVEQRRAKRQAVLEMQALDWVI